MLYVVTGREVAAGRMAPDETLRQAAEKAISEPYLTCEQLIAMADAKAEAAAAPPPDKPREFLSKLFGK